MHARARFASGLRVEYAVYRGYEEGLVEGLARIITREKAGWTPVAKTYNYWVKCYKVLAEEIGVSHKELLRRVWKEAPGTVRINFVDIVDEFRIQKGRRPFTSMQRSDFGAVADRLLSTNTHSAPADARKIRQEWRKALP